ncbi:conserved hypothetical protein [Ricinus communis]|uniref:Uncharacterized protein n=1 Tax=Ricinus communis TaxID=3988 RepID=B9T8Q6_RICCO|nr:conserved hypothetical protein [Ricinus communis]
MVSGQQRIQRGHQRHSHDDVEDAHRTRVLQHAAHGHAKRRPAADADDADDAKHPGQQAGVADAEALRQVGGQRAERHHPGLRINPLEGGGAPEAHRPRDRRLVGAHRRGVRQLPRQPEKVHRAAVFEHDLQHRHPLEHHVQPEAGRENHEREAAGDAEQVRQRAHKTVIQAGGQDHGVVRAGRDGADGGKGAQGQQQFGRHDLSVRKVCLHCTARCTGTDLYTSPNRCHHCIGIFTGTRWSACATACRSSPAPDARAPGRSRSRSPGTRPPPWGWVDRSGA